MLRAPCRLPLIGLALGLTSVPTARAAEPWLADVTASSGLCFRHHALRSPSWYLPETMGSGAALLDLEGDGDLDVLLLDSWRLPGAPVTTLPLGEQPRHALLRNDSTREGLRFAALASPAGLDGLAAMGACAGDVDRDGDTDVFVTGLPSGRLLLNEAGSLRRAPADGGIADAGWGTSCTFLDHDRDGDLDLFVAHYVRWSAAAEKRCGGEREGYRSYCPPDQYEAEQDRLWVGDGKGRFRDGTEAAGLLGERGKGLGVVAADLDGDGRTDLYVANDQTPSALWLGQEGGRFRDVGLRSGTALSDDGRAQAGMGLDAGDADGDLDLDLTKTNFSMEANNLYLREASAAAALRFRDAVRESGLAELTLPMLGFGTVFADLDADGDQDLFVVNGHILPNVHELHPELEQAQADVLFENVGPAKGAKVPSFRNAAARWAPASAAKGVGRGLLAGDLDGDGDLDLVITRNDGEARVLRNGTNPARWLGLVLTTTASAPGAPGASVVLRSGGASALGVRRTGGSYLSACDERVLFGLARFPAGQALTAEVRWPSGRREVFPVGEIGRYVTLVEGKGTAAP